MTGVDPRRAARRMAAMPVRVTMVMVAPVAMVVVVGHRRQGLFASRAPEHPQRHADDDQARGELEVRLQRDAVDARVIESVRTGKPQSGNGIIKTPDEVGGYPKYAFNPAEVPPDGDNDGMPDAWETKYKLDPAKPDDGGAADADQDGYTNVEEYLNGTNPTQAIDYKNLDNNVDTISGQESQQ